jgi:endonuclease/exonuclease/phosphatase family metal-dependent hydrolase
MNPLRVMCFNIRGSRFDDGANRWPERAALNVATIAAHAPDLIGFQELDLVNLELYRERLPQYEYVLGPPYNDHEPFQYPTIAFDPRRLRLLDQGEFWLSTTPERHSAAWDTACIRAANWARFAWPDAGLEFLHLNTHLDHVSELARVEGARLIVARVAQLAGPALPALITGDFNCRPGSEAYRAFAEAGYDDTYKLAGGSEEVNTFHGFEGGAFVAREGTPLQIDWVLLRQGEPRLAPAAWRVVEDAAPPLYPSDHYPIIVDLAPGAESRG